MHSLEFSSRSISDYNTMWDESMDSPHQEGYCLAFNKEIKILNNRISWEVVEQEDWMHILPYTCFFLNSPGGIIHKPKSRFCSRGDRQTEGVHLFDTFYPVTNWTTVRIMLILSTILSWSTKQVNYTAYFFHATININLEWDSLF